MGVRLNVFMRYELGVLQLLVASEGRRNTPRVQVVERALGVPPGALDSAIQFLRRHGLVNPDGTPSDAGRSRARGLNRHVRRPLGTGNLPSRLPPRTDVHESGVYESDERDERNTIDLDILDVLDEQTRKSA